MSDGSFHFAPHLQHPQLSMEDELFDGAAAGSVQGSLSTNGFDAKSASRFERGVFGLYYTMVKDRPQHRIFSRMLVPLKLLQFLAFSFHRDFPWNRGVTSWFQTFLEWSQFNFSGDPSYDTQIAFFALAAIVFFASFTNFIYVMYMFQSSVITSVWPIRMLRIVAGTLFTFLFIPLTRILLSNVNCNYSNGWSNAYLEQHPDVECFGWPNGFLFVVSVIALLFLIPLAMMTSLVYYDGDFKSKDIAARHHGRMDFFMLVIKLLLVFSEVLFSGKMGIRIACLIISALSYLLALLVYMPYYHQRMNNVMIANFSVILFSAICTAICFGIGDAGSVVAPSLFFGLFLPVFYAGYKFSQWRYDTLLRLVQSAYPDGQPLSSIAQIDSQSGSSAFFFETDVEIATRHLIMRHPQNLAYAHRLYLVGVKLFPQSSYVLQSYVLFIANVKKNFPLTLKPIRALKRLDLFIDTRFLIYVVEVDWTKSNHSQELGGGGTMDVMHYVDFQSNYNRAKTYHVKTRKLIQTFWEKVMDSTDEQFVKELPQLASDIVRNERKCEEAYMKLLDTYPESRVLLRSYGQFIESVKNDKDWAQELYNQADALEDPHAAERLKDETSSYRSHSVGHKQRSQSNWVKKRDRAKLEVVRLLQLGTYAIGFSITLAIIAFFTLGRISHLNLADFLDSATDLSESSKHAQTPFLHLRSLQLASSLDNTYYFNSNRTLVESDMLRLLELHQQLYDDSMGMDLGSEWTRQQFVITEKLPTGNSDVRTDLTSFWDGVNSYLQRTRYESLSSPSSYADGLTSDDYWFIMTNGPTVFRNMYLQMESTYESAHHDEIEFWQQSFSIILGLSFAVNFMFHVFFVRTLEKLQLFREKTLNIFLVIPKPVISSLLQNLRKARDEDEEDDQDRHDLGTINESQENLPEEEMPRSSSMNKLSRNGSVDISRQQSSQQIDAVDGQSQSLNEEDQPDDVKVDADVENDILRANKNDAPWKSKQAPAPVENDAAQVEAANFVNVDEKTTPAKKKKDRTIHARHTIGLFIVQLTFLGLILAPFFTIQEQKSFVPEVTAAGNRWDLVTRIRFFAREYVLGTSQFWSPSEVQDILKNDALRLSEVHNNLKHGGAGLPGSDQRYEPQHQLLYKLQDCLMLNRSACAPGRIPGFVDVSLDSLLQRYISKAITLSEHPPNSTNLNANNEDYLFLWAAGVHDLNDALYTSLQLYHEEGDKSLDSMVTIINALFGVSICVLLSIYGKLNSIHCLFFFLELVFIFENTEYCKFMRLIRFITTVFRLNLYYFSFALNGNEPGSFCPLLLLYLQQSRSSATYFYISTG
eukprot:TRINITY_DN189_c0_g2_i2.p1 TRINITY_DN189_c0_g2~~TRINITY_DN189_c0_g2_i2.p1  ORF type:complete len:1404 (-),score=265.50 TRINITY_DN189_c0_g2_i2:815-4780(-)